MINLQIKSTNFNFYCHFKINIKVKYIMSKIYVNFINLAVAYEGRKPCFNVGSPKYLNI